MVAKIKEFDCVAMKETIQAQHAKEYADLSQDEIRKRVQQKLETSEHPAAVWWRRISSKTTYSPPRNMP
ncbi:MAG TPA: hypothetical protein PLI09_18555 [Candidatus Hydrogenedentes bacterium]|nr:hypothetical protein [Candidatus Hydrogenedentota bacterium]